MRPRPAWWRRMGSTRGRAAWRSTLRATVMRARWPARPGRRDATAAASPSTAPAPTSAWARSAPSTTPPSRSRPGCRSKPTKNDVAIVGSWAGSGPMLWVDHLATPLPAHPRQQRPLRLPRLRPQPDRRPVAAPRRHLRRHHRPLLHRRHRSRLPRRHRQRRQLQHLAHRRLRHHPRRLLRRRHRRRPHLQPRPHRRRSRRPTWASP